MPDPLLFVTQVAAYRDGPAGVHGVLEQATTAMAQLAEGVDLDLIRVADVRELPTGAIAAAGAVVLFTIGETPWRDDQQRELLDAVRSASLGIVAVHSATDSCYGWDEYGALVGARFDGHPWTQDVAIEIEAPTHPAFAHLRGPWAWHDEVYQFRDLRPDTRVLARVPVDQLDQSAAGAKQPAFGYPVSWCFEEGGGRVFSSSLGHFPHAWETPDFLRHLAGGLTWVRDRA